MKHLQRCTVLGAVIVGALGCSELTGRQVLPAGTTDPSYYNTKTGAVEEYDAARVQFFQTLAQYIVDSGLLTDELQDINTGVGAGVLLQNGTAVTDPLDERILPPTTNSASQDGSADYGGLQDVRAFAAQALGMLATYDTAAADSLSQRSMRAEMHAMTGYAEIWLADLFCSGVPLSTLDFQHDYTYAPSSTTTQVYQAAVAQFDTALMLVDTSTQVQNLARVGQGRAYLDLGLFAVAADDVQSVPDGFRYQMSSTGANATGWTGGTTGHFNSSFSGATVSDQEGGNGLPYIASGDPRSTDTATYLNTTTEDSVYFPLKYRSYLTANTAVLTVASGVEARLIQAEAALQAGDVSTWLTTLKTLHDTLPGVTPLTDPGLNSTNPDSARVALTFRERAEWLYLTGTRQGDLRRLLRQYPQWYLDQSQVYPTGVYLAPGQGVYGSDVNAAIPSSESVNPLSHGCLNRAP